MSDRQLNANNFPAHEFTEALETPSERKLIKNITLLVTASIALLLLWSIFTKVEEIAKAKGQVVPLGHRQVIQSQLGGTISAMEVEEGDVVKAGDVLAQFVAINSQSAKEELLSQRANLVMTIERLDAFIEKRTADFGEFTTQFPGLVIQQRQALSGMDSERDAIKELSQAELNKSQAQYSAVENEIPALKDQISASEKTVTMYSTLAKTGGISQVQILESQQKLDSYLRELTAMQGQEKVLASELINQKKQLQQKQATILKEVQANVSEKQAELLIVEARLRSSDSDVLQNTITSPVDGIIQSLPSSSEGSVIAPGGTVAVIVPTTATALLEAKLSPRDIGFVNVGQNVRIKIDAFDYSRYGALDGIVKKISPTTDADERGGVFYKVQVSIAKPYFGESPGRFDLIPGMTGEADIVTGDKTVFQYLWKPVFTNVSSAFGER
ncbi:HlyD family type I secretion periplasmic adaptor subunit [Colwellia demingiae]|uniref:Membrane fusion protein (MFP) family protein n=1 Tax=Colwellia demingiae TaxID=89401 RepID=A0A5C6QH16_9GAMM|nr:HlyD family type I secretion periplasmic adaptor subunit [Colwellia demingiae]TWX67882.1 HlyD family type I secretion periplasmic adaptor subunit [Colwellia demingiae]